MWSFIPYLMLVFFFIGSALMSATGVTLHAMMKKPAEPPNQISRFLGRHNERMLPMRAFSLSFVALLGVAAVMVVTPRPGFAQVNHLPIAKGQAVKEAEEVGYRYRRRGYRPYYRPYYGGYYRPYYRPYYGYPYYYRPYYRPWWGPGIGFGFWF